MTYLKEVLATYNDSPNIDAFGRLRVSQLTTQFDAKQIHDKLPLFIDEEVIGAGATSTHSTSLAKTTLNTNGFDDTGVILQTKQRFNYQSGKSNLMFFTFNALGEGNNISVVTSRSGTETSRVIRADWNDPLDGTGVSGVTHNFDNNTIFAIDYEWLGIGRVRYYIIKDGNFINFHSVDFTDSTEVYMSSPNQPLRWECIDVASAHTNRVGYFSSSTTSPFNTAFDGIFLESTDSSGSFNVICSSFNSEGSINKIGKDGGIDDNGVHLNANSISNWYYAIGLRLQSTKLDTIVDILDTKLLAKSNDSFLYRICINPTYAGSVTYNSITDYSVEYGLGATANTISTFGHILGSGFGLQQSTAEATLNTAIKLGSQIDGTVDEIVICVKPISNGLDLHRAINWVELS